MHVRKFTIPLLSLALFAALIPLAAVAEEKAEEGKWESIFNGKDLTGWTAKIKGYELGKDPYETFRVQDGVMKVAYDKYGNFDSQFGHLFYKEAFSNYRIRLEYRFVSDQVKGGPGWAFRNNGLMIHGQDPKTMRKDQDFPVSIEVQLLGGNGNNTRPTGNLCTPGTNVVIGGKLHTTHCLNSKSKTYHGDQWVKLEVVAHGSGKVQHFINGEMVLEYEQTQYDPHDADAKKLMEAAKGEILISGGTISLQAESHPCEFRKIEVMKLKE